MLFIEFDRRHLWLVSCEQAASRLDYGTQGLRNDEQRTFHHSLAVEIHDGNPQWNQKCRPGAANEGDLPISLLMCVLVQVAPEAFDSHVEAAANGFNLFACLDWVFE